MRYAGLLTAVATAGHPRPWHNSDIGNLPDGHAAPIRKTARANATELPAKNPRLTVASADTMRTYFSRVTIEPKRDSLSVNEGLPHQGIWGGDRNQHLDETPNREMSFYQMLRWVRQLLYRPTLEGEH
jgi:hypothetical protein